MYTYSLRKSESQPLRFHTRKSPSRQGEGLLLFVATYSGDGWDFPSYF